ncbi:type II toxin-antitoxin system HigB family toxin [Albibacterium indicum]|uniref:type II toxin-antitoxin system HigB family toxin n=1 Tax=Albibacterium indicum TaxID=2292082 RepID=UPI003742DDE2
MNLRTGTAVPAIPNLYCYFKTESLSSTYRLIVDIEHRLKIVFVVWFGTHIEYVKINVKTVSSVKTNKIGRI